MVEQLGLGTQGGGRLRRLGDHEVVAQAGLSVRAARRRQRGGEGARAHDGGLELGGGGQDGGVLCSRESDHHPQRDPGDRCLREG